MFNLFLEIEMYFQVNSPKMFKEFLKQYFIIYLLYL